MDIDETSNGIYRRNSADAQEGLMELSNLVTNPGGGEGDLPPFELRRDDSTEALNLSLHQVNN